MVDKVTLSDLVNLQNETTAVNTINNNNDAVVAAINKTLSRDGTTPNTMGASLDMNSNRILNLPAPLAPTEPLRVMDVDIASVPGQIAAAQAAAAAALVSETNAAASASTSTTQAAAAAASATAAASSATSLRGTSTTSITIGTGTKVFTTQTGKSFAAGNWVQISSDSNPSVNYMIAQITTYSGSTLTVSVPTGGDFGSGTLTDWTIQVSGKIGATGSTGAAGNDGATGNAGAPGVDGLTINANLDYNFDITTSDADPGNGFVRFNNASLGSATFMYISKTDRNATNLGTVIDRWDDSTTSGDKGSIVFFKITDPTRNLYAKVTGNLTDATTYWKVPLSVTAAGTTPVAADRVVVSFSRTGNAGAGTGDTVGAASSIAGGIPIFADTTGKVLADGNINFSKGKIAVSTATAWIGLAAGNTGDTLTYDSSQSSGIKWQAGLKDVCQGRLTLTSGVPVTTSDVTAAGTLYYTPYQGNTIALYDGSTWSRYFLTEISSSLSGLTSGLNYDVFIYLSGGVLTLSLTAWTNDTTRATALAIQDGIWCKTGDLLKRYVGTVRMSATSQCEDSVAKRYVYNLPRVAVPRKMVKLNSTQHTYASATVRAYNNDLTNSSFSFVDGLGYNALIVYVGGNFGTAACFLYFGLNSTTATANSLGLVIAGAACMAESIIIPVGYNYVACLEAASSSTTVYAGYVAGTLLM